MKQWALQLRSFQRGTVGLVLVMLAAVAQPASAARPHPRRKDQFKDQVEKLEEVWRTAQLNGDFGAMEQLLSDDYVGITMTGQVVTKTQQLERMKNGRLVLSKIEVSDLKIKLIGSTAVVTSLSEVEGNNDGTPMHGTFRSTRVYSRMLNGSWKITNYESTRVGSAPFRNGGSRAGQPHADGPHDGDTPGPK